MKKVNFPLILGVLHAGACIGIAIGSVDQEMPMRTEVEKYGWSIVFIMASLVAIPFLCGIAAGIEISKGGDEDE